MKNILLLLFISYFIISCSSNTKTPFEEEAYKMLKTEISDTFSSVGNDVDIFYVFQHTRGSKLGVEYNNLLKNAFMALFSMII